MTTTIMQLMETFVGFSLSLKAITVASVEIWFCVFSIRVLLKYLSDSCYEPLIVCGSWYATTVIWKNYS